MNTLQYVHLVLGVIAAICPQLSATFPAGAPWFNLLATLAASTLAGLAPAHAAQLTMAKQGPSMAHFPVREPVLEQPKAAHPESA